MNFHLVHDRGFVRKVDFPDAPDLTLDAPRTPQRLKLKRLGAFAARNPIRETKTITNYTPGKLEQLAPDQCRFMAGTDGIACGAKGFPWCDHHRAIVYSKGQTS